MKPETIMSRMRIFRSILAVVIALFVLKAVPTHAAQGTVIITALAIDPKTPTTLYAGTSDGGVFKSTDGGATWNATGLNNVPVWSLMIDPQVPTTLYAGAHAAGTIEAGVLKSTDGGSTWTALSLTPAYVSALAIDPRTPSTLYVGAYWGGVYKSTDGGATWSPTGVGPFIVNSLTVDPITQNTVYSSDAFVGDEGFTWNGGVFKSIDGAATWITTGLAGGSFGRLAVDPWTPTTLYVGGSWLIDYQTGAIGLFKSTDGGTTWGSTSLTNISAGNPVIDPRTPSTLYATAYDAGSYYVGVFKSTDSGATWNAVNSGLTDTLAAYRRSPEVGSLAIEPLTPTTDPSHTLALYAGTEIGVFKSVDGGEHWSPTSLFQQSPLVGLTLNPAVVFYAASSTGTVTLATPAPPGGITVTLSSDTPAVATVPASVTVPAGATSADFIVSTNAVTWAVTISATFEGVTASANLMAYATTLSSLHLSPTNVSGGTLSTGTVTLSAAAPAGGATILLSSSNSAVATVPASVTVPAGATWANFTVSTNSVTTSTAVTISADNYWALLNVTPGPTLSSVTLNPTSVIGGSPSTGTVILSGVAPTGGTVVTLSSSNTAIATVPTSVDVTAGATSASFTVSTTTSCNPGAVTVSGASGGVTRSAGLTVTPGPTDTIAIQQADYFASRREFRVAAKDTNSTATLRVYVTSTGELINQLIKGGDGTYRAQFTWPVNPQNITIQSSLCGRATKDVTLK